MSELRKTLIALAFVAAQDLYDRLDARDLLQDEVLDLLERRNELARARLPAVKVSTTNSKIQNAELFRGQLAFVQAVQIMLQVRALLAATEDASFARVVALVECGSSV